MFFRGYLVVDQAADLSESGLLANPHEIARDCSLVGRAIREGWLTPARRAALQTRLYEVATQLLQRPDDLEGLKLAVPITRVLEASYQFDVRLAERVEKTQAARVARESRQPAGEQGAVELIIPPHLSQGSAIEDGRQQLLERIRAARSVGGDG